MAKKKEDYTVIPVEEKEMEEKPNSTEANQPEDELEERFDKDFWLKVKCFWSLLKLMFDLCPL